VEIKVGVLRADMMKDAGNCAADAGIETFDRIDMDGVPNVFAAGMLALDLIKSSNQVARPTPGTGKATEESLLSTRAPAAVPVMSMKAIA